MGLLFAAPFLLCVPQLFADFSCPASATNSSAIPEKYGDFACPYILTGTEVGREAYICIAPISRKH